MVPRIAPVGPLTGITRGGSPIAVALRTIKGVEYAFFAAQDGSYVATYNVDTTPPAITNVAAAPGLGGTALVTWDTATEASDSRVDYGTSPASLVLSAANGALVNAHSLQLTGLLPTTTYHYRVRSQDSFGNFSEYPASPAPPLSFTTPSAMWVDTTMADFSLGSPGGCAVVGGNGDGEVRLSAALQEDFGGTDLPAGWASYSWNAGERAPER